MRLTFNIALVLSILWLPWWLGALVLMAACLAISGFYEALAYGILYDALYATPLGLHGFVFIGSAFALTAFLISTVLRDKLAWQ